MPFPSRSEAVDFFEWVIAKRNKTPYPFRDDMEDTFRRHCHGVAIIAETIASKTPYLNADLAYVMGLLHDCGRIVDEYATGDYHGVVGYHLLCQKGWPQLAKISVTHNFVDKDFDIELMPHPRKDMIFCFQCASLKLVLAGQKKLDFFLIFKLFNQLPDDFLP